MHQCQTLLGKSLISTRVDSAYWSISINSNRSSASTSSVSCNATSPNYGISPEKGLRIINRIKRGQIRTELVGAKSPSEQRERLYKPLSIGVRQVQTLKISSFFYFPILLPSKFFGLTICCALRDLVPFVQFKKCEKHPWRSVTFNKVTG